MPYGHVPDSTGHLYAAAAQGFQQVAQAAARFGEIRARAEKAKYDQGVKIEAATLQSQMELSATEQLEMLKLTETEPDQYTTKAQKVIQNVYQETLRQAKYDQTKAALQQHLQTVLKTKGVEVLKYSNELYRGRNLGLLETNLANLKTLGSMAPDQPSVLEEGRGGEFAMMTRVKGASDYFREGQEAIADATALLGPKGAAEQQLAWRQGFAYERGYRALRDDPDANIGLLRTLMKPEQYDRLEKQQDAARKSREAEWDKYYARLEKQAEEERQGLLTTARSDALQGQLTLEGLERLRQARVIKKPDEYDVLYRIIANPKERPSDPEVLRRVDLAVHRQMPTISEAQLDGLLDQGLNRKDWLAAKEKLVGRRTAIANEEQAQAEEQLRLSVGMSGPLDVLDREDQQLLAIAMRELTARSSAFPENGGKERPLSVAREIADRIAPIRQERLRLTGPKIGRTLRPEIQAETSAEATARLNRMRGTWSREEILQEERKIIDMFRAEQRALDAGAKKPEAGGGPKPLRQNKPKTGTAED